MLASDLINNAMYCYSNVSASDLFKQLLCTVVTMLALLISSTTLCTVTAMLASDFINNAMYCYSNVSF